MEIRKDGFYQRQALSAIFRRDALLSSSTRLLGRPLCKNAGCGPNHGKTVMCWNLHEPHEGEFCFGEASTLGGLLPHHSGIWPVCYHSTWSVYLRRMGFCRFPAWLLKITICAFGVMNLFSCKRSMPISKRVFQEISPLQDTNGGNIIALQI